MKVLSISEDGKISLSIKRALENERTEQQPRERRERRNTPPPKPDGSYTWMPKKNEPASFEEMMNRFKQTSDEKFSDLKRKNPEAKRSKRGAVK
jgi:S1 RNA binding domain protein